MEENTNQVKEAQKALDSVQRIRRNRSRQNINQQPSGRSQVYSGNPPRKLADLLSVSTVIAPFEERKTRDEAQLVSFEYFERAQKFPLMTGKGLCKNTERLVVMCSCKTSNCGKVMWSFSSPMSTQCRWICKEVHPFICEGPTPVSRTTGCTAYNIDMLKPLIIGSFNVSKMKNLTAEMCRALLTAYCPRPLSASFIQRLRNAVSVNVFGSPYEAVNKLPCVAQALKKKGWVVQLFYLTSSEMSDELLEIAKSDFEKRKKALASNSLMAYQNGSTSSPLLFGESVIPKVEDGKKYIVGYLLCPPNASHLHDYCHRFSVSDFTHCKHRSLKGILGSRYMLNSNRSLVDIAHVRLLRNEDEKAWRILNQATVLSVPFFDDKQHVDTSDADKGAHAAFRRHFPTSGRFLDYFHRVQALSKSAPRSLVVQHYQKAFNCKSTSELDDCKQLMASNVRTVLEKFEDSEQYPVAARWLRGNMGSSAVESANNALNDVREMCFTSSMLGLAENIKVRYDKQASFANAAEGILTPTFAKKMHPIKLDSYRFGSDSVSISEDRTYALVKSKRIPGKTYKVIFDEIKNVSSLSCDGNCSVLTGLPCAHQVAASREFGVDITYFMHEFDTVSHWKDMYRNHGIEIPSTKEIEDQIGLQDDTLRLPPALKQPKGRPKEACRHQSILDKLQVKKRKMTCSVCQSDTHTKANCPTVKTKVP